MIEINHSYFKNISNYVNSKVYNSFDEKCIDDLILCEEIPDKKLISCLEETGFIRLKMSQKSQEALCWLSHQLGPTFNDKNPKKMPHAKVEASNNGKFFINSNLAQPIHTDEGHTTQYPRFVALYCLNEASVGGVSITVEFNTLYEALRAKFGSGIDVLFNKDVIKVKNVYGIESKPILIKLEHNRIGISYSPVLQHLWCDVEVFNMFDFITSFVHNPANQSRFKLQSGEMLVFDNCRILHGRTGFSQNDNRLLYRYWFGNSQLC